MARTRLLLILLLAADCGLTGALFIFDADCDRTLSSLRQTDAELNHVLTAAESSLAQSLTAACSAPLPPGVEVPTRGLYLDADDHSTILELTNVKVTTDAIQLSDFKPNLQFLNMQFQSDLKFVQISGDYKLLNVTSGAFVPLATNFIIGLENVVGFVNAGFSLNGLSLVAHNIDVTYNASQMVISVMSGEATFNISTGSLYSDKVNPTIIQHVIKSLSHTLNPLIEQRLNSVLGGISINDVFANETAINRYQLYAATHETELNGIVDSILDSITYQINVSNKDQVKLPDVQKSFSRRLAFMNFTGNFVATNGSLKSLSSLYRTTDMTLQRVDNGVMFGGGVGLRHLEIDFCNYTVKFLKLKTEGNVTVNVGLNSVIFKVTAGYRNKKCALSLSYIRVAKLEDIKVHVTGVGTLNNIVSDIADWYTSSIKDQIVKKVEAIAKEAIDNALSSIDCSSFLPPQ